MATYIHLPERSGIYQIVNKISEKRYVGYASNIRQRLKGHISDLSLNKHPNDYLQKAWNKYGANAFSSLVLEECSKENLCLKEDYWVKVLKVCDRYFGYNIKDTDPDGKPGHSLETCNKLSISNKGKKPSALCRQKVREYWDTHIMTEDHKTACREGLRKVDWFKLRESKRKSIIDTLTGKVFPSLRVAAETIGIPKSRLSKYLLGTRTNKTTLKYLQS